MRKAIAIDFDGCLCQSAWPGIGRPNLKVINAAIREQQNGAALILWTCRVGEKLEAAVAWCKAHGLEFDAVNDNLPERIAVYGANPRKVNADEYWDDLAVVTKEAEEGLTDINQSKFVETVAEIVKWLRRLARSCGVRLTRFDRIRLCETPEEMAVELNANNRRFCPKSYWKKWPDCTVPCGECITAWLREEATGLK